MLRCEAPQAAPLVVLVAADPESTTIRFAAGLAAQSRRPLRLVQVLEPGPEASLTPARERAETLLGLAAAYAGRLLVGRDHVAIATELFHGEPLAGLVAMTRGAWGLVVGPEQTSPGSQVGVDVLVDHGVVVVVVPVGWIRVHPDPTRAVGPGVTVGSARDLPPVGG